VQQAALPEIVERTFLPGMVSTTRLDKAARKRLSAIGVADSLGTRTRKFAEQNSAPSPRRLSRKAKICPNMPAETS
jgi:hypothetical protein